MFTNASHFTIHGGNYTVISSDDSTMINQWLNAPDCSTNYVAAADKKFPGTGEWVFDLDEYKKWRSKPGVLWIQGPAGSGKTVLTTTIQEHVQKVYPNAVWYHYFDTRDNTGLKTTYRGFLLSLIQQIGLDNKGINPALYTLYKSNKFKKVPSSELQKVLEIMIKERNGGYIVVDAMDECTEVNKVLDWLSVFSDKLWILVTSRIADGFGKSVLQFALGSKESHIDKDIAMYLESEIEIHSKFEGDVQGNIKETLKKGAHGVFRWAECQLRAVQRCSTVRSVKKVLNKLPSDLQKTYEQALKKCQEGEENAEEAQHLLLWLLYAYEPLTTKQINAIMAVNPKEQVVDHPHMEVQVEKIIDSTLVTVGQNNVVQLAHASVKEYLIIYSQVKQTKDLFELNEQLAHDIMMQTTIIYLMQKKNISYKETPFGVYAVKNWLAHASKVEVYKVKGEAQNLIQIMLDDKDVYFARWKEMSLRYENTWEKSTQGTPLYYGALHGLYEVIQKLISELNLGTDIDIGGGTYGTPLQAASLKGYESVVKLLLEKGADVNAQGGWHGNALQAASSGGYEPIVKLLLEMGADVNAQGGVYGNALQAASSEGYEHIVKLLLEMGADVNAQGGGYGNALQAASSEGNEPIVKLLLEMGADVNAQGGGYGNTLQAASSEGHEAIVKLLLEVGANVNAQGGEYGNALQAASSEGYETIVKLLLEMGADVNAQGGVYENALQAALSEGSEPEMVADINTQGGGYGNALQAASSKGSEAIVKLLLEKGADVNAQGGVYGNALQAASSKGSEVIVKLLLEKGADVNAQGGIFGNALRAASSEGHGPIVKLLLEVGADVNAQGGEYGNALQAASSEGHEHIVKLLLEMGADANAQGGEYGNALHAASLQGHKNIVKILLEKGAVNHTED
ncbi:ectomycorrhiza-induced ankyrin-domain/NACHT-domain-containing protein [Lentinula edodes]|nr:ectomycorrhiza-induced ankyrin-domain/NACHT-domain-containing protein [Lentinula edodes]